MSIWFFVLIGILIINFQIFPEIFAQETPITISGTMQDVIFDGKWTFEQEWKQSALEKIKTQHSVTYIRTAHQDDFIYVMLDVINDKQPSQDDIGVVCFRNLENNTIDMSDSYCFQTNPINTKAKTAKWQAISQSFIEVENPEGLVFVGGVSDQNDRYSKTPHPSYEFKIPVELFGRYDRYGFFVGVYDSEEHASYSWPENINVDLSFEMPSPSEWGMIISPDKSLPEYPVPILVLFVTIMAVILLSLKNRILFVTNKFH